ATEETLRDVYQEQMAKAGKGSGQLILVQPGDSFEDSGKQSYKINPKSKHDFERLFECFIEKQISLENICFAWPVRQAQWRNANSVNDSLERGIYSFLFLCQSLIKQGLENKVQLLYLYSAKLDEPQPHNEAVSGFVKALRLEHPKLLCKTVE